MAEMRRPESEVRSRKSAVRRAAVRVSFFPRASRVFTDVCESVSDTPKKAPRINQGVLSRDR
jgi:hypothetical protein